MCCNLRGDVTLNMTDLRRKFANLNKTSVQQKMCLVELWL
jgi:hypothetical protein